MSTPTTEEFKKYDGEQLIKWARQIPELNNDSVEKALRKGRYTGKGLRTGNISKTDLKSDGLNTNDAAILLDAVEKIGTFLLNFDLENPSQHSKGCACLLLILVYSKFLTLSKPAQRNKTLPKPTIHFNILSQNRTNTFFYLYTVQFLTYF